ncbi:MAG: helix-turn-helix domain-containing protein, partial [Pirellulaceae bacterium]
MKADVGIPVAEAAERLRVNPSRVRAMIRSRILDAQKLGDRWFVDPASLDRREAARPSEGRPYSARNAWALLLLQDCPEGANKGKWLKQLPPWTVSRLRSRLRDSDIASLVPRFRR